MLITVETGLRAYEGHCTILFICTHLKFSTIKQQQQQKTKNKQPKQNKIKKTKQNNIAESIWQPGKLS